MNMDTPLPDLGPVNSEALIEATFVKKETAWKKDRYSQEKFDRSPGCSGRFPCACLGHAIESPVLSILTYNFVEASARCGAGRNNQRVGV